MSVATNHHRVVFVGCVEAGYFCAQQLIKAGILPAAIVSIDQTMAERNQVSGYSDLFRLETSCLRYRPETYAMKGAADLAFFREMQFDILVVLGWQRLIPAEIIETLGVCGLTIHGSGEGLPKGRGRSPMNWAIIKGFDRFYLSLLTLSPEADGGRILGTQPFDILPTDTIRTLYYKNAQASTRLLVEHIPRLLAAGCYGQEQDESRATYYPKRTPDDGKIDWSCPAEEIERLIRAVTRPYPGAFADSASGRLTIWQGQRFDRQLVGSEPPGTVAAVFPDNAFIVQTGDCYLLVLEYEGRCPAEGDRLQ